MSEVLSDCIELQALFESDQNERKPPISEDRGGIVRRDRERRGRVRDLLSQGLVRTGTDHYRAAVVLVHGFETTDYEEALVLARRGAELEPDRAEIRSLCGLIQDRLLLSRGQPQWYGTQRELKDGKVVMSPLDPDAVTDDDRRALGLPTLEERYRELERLNAPRRRSPEPHPPRSPG